VVVWAAVVMRAVKVPRVVWLVLGEAAVETAALTEETAAKSATAE
jgi:hypothetical protein